MGIYFIMNIESVHAVGKGVCAASFGMVSGVVSVWDLSR